MLSPSPINGASESKKYMLGESIYCTSLSLLVLWSWFEEISTQIEFVLTPAGHQGIALHTVFNLAKAHRLDHTSVKRIFLQHNLMGHPR